MYSRYLILVLPLLQLYGCICNTSEAKADARRDIRRGELEFRIYGLPRPADAEYANLLKGHLGVNLRRVGSCTVSEQLRRDTDAYNGVMQREIEARYGKGILERLQNEAEKSFASTQPRSHSIQ